MVPVIETERLRLRELRETDLGPHSAALRDAEVVRFLGGSPLAREEVWRKMLASHAMWSIFGFGYWAVELKESRAFGGVVGFADYKRDVTPSIEGLPEAGWIMAPSAQGQGYAGEAMTAALRWADERLGAAEYPAIISPGNEPSIRLARKLGFAGPEQALYRREPVLLFRRRRSG